VIEVFCSPRLFMHPLVPPRPLVSLFSNPPSLPSLHAFTPPHCGRDAGIRERRLCPNSWVALLLLLFVHAARSAKTRQDGNRQAKCGTVHAGRDGDRVLIQRSQVLSGVAWIMDQARTKGSTEAAPPDP